MAFQPGHNAYMKIDGTNITAYTDLQSLDRVRNLLETTVFGVTGRDRTYVAGLRAHTIALSGPWDPTLDAAMITADDGATGAFTFNPEGNDGDDVTYTGNAFITNYSISVGVDGKVEWSASFNPTGTVGRGTV